MGDRLADTPTVLAAGQALRSDLITNLKTTEPLFINVMILPWGLRLKKGQGGYIIFKAKICSGVLKFYLKNKDKEHLAYEDQ